MSDNKNQLASALYQGARALRNKMDANEYKNYLLGIVFFKYLSDNLLYEVADEIGDGREQTTLDQAQKLYDENADDPDLQDELVDTLAYSISPSKTFTTIVSHINDHTFQLSTLSEAFKEIEGYGDTFEGLFKDIDLFSPRLGSTAQKQANTISDVLTAISKIELVKAKNDVLGDAYEYLIKQFASETGKKAGEFYTPRQVSELLTRLTLINRDYPNGMNVYDPTMGSGSLLLNFKRFAQKKDEIIYYGQEINTTTFNLARMNMILHKVDPNDYKFRNADTLDEDWPPVVSTPFDSVVMNPPYSQHWSAKKGFLDDPRFSKYGVLPPKSRADFAFLLHGYYHLKNGGTMAIVLPHGVLFRGDSEGKIRRKLVENGSIDAIIGLPANLFYNAKIPTLIMVLKKDKTDRNIFFIDASREFKKATNQNVLREQDVQKIISTYKKRQNIDEYAHLATFEEIRDNDFNLNIPRYVDTFKPEPLVNVKQVANEIHDLDKQISNSENELGKLLGQLTSGDREIMNGLQDVINDFKEDK